MDDQPMRPPANPIHPKIKTAWRLGAAGGAILATGGALVILALQGLPLWPVVFVPLVGGPAAWALPAAIFDRWRYEIRERDVYIAHGLVMHKVVLIPFDRIQYVQTNQGPFDRMFTLMQLAIHTAGGTESIPGLTIEEAERLRGELSTVAGTQSV